MSLGFVILDLPEPPYFFNLKKLIETWKPDQIIVIVQGTESDALFWRDFFPGTQLLVHPIYLSFSETCNRAVHMLSTETVFFWDPNMLVDEIHLSTVLTYFEESSCAVVVPTVWCKSGYEFKRVSLTRRVLRSGLFWFLTEWDEILFPGTVEGFLVEWAFYGAFFIKRDAFLRVGGFDRRIPVAYGGDWELGQRLTSAGYTMRHTERVVFRIVRHLRWDRLFGVDYVDQERLRSHYMIFWKHARGIGVWIKHLWLIFVRFLTFRLGHQRAIGKALIMKVFKPAKSPGQSHLNA